MYLRCELRLGNDYLHRQLENPVKKVGASSTKANLPTFPLSLTINRSHFRHGYTLHHHPLCFSQSKPLIKRPYSLAARGKCVLPSCEGEVRGVSVEEEVRRRCHLSGHCHTTAQLSKVSARRMVLFSGGRPFNFLFLGLGCFFWLFW